MFENEEILSNSDISFLYDSDFYNSSIIYKLPNISLDNFKTDYLCREDLISSDNYGDTDIGLGLTILSLYELIKDEELTKDKTGTYLISNGLKPFNDVTLFNSSEVSNSQSDIVQKNELTDIDINRVRRPDKEEYVYDKESNTFITPEEMAKRLEASSQS